MAEPTLQEAIEAVRSFWVWYEKYNGFLGDVPPAAFVTVLAAAESAAADRERANANEKDAAVLRVNNEHLAAALHAHAAECAECDPQMAGEPERIRAMHTAYLEEGAWERAEGTDRNAKRYRWLRKHFVTVAPLYGFTEGLRHDALDDAIDDRLAAQPAPDAGQEEVT